MITKEIIEKLIEYFPDASGKLSEGLDLLNIAIDDLLVCINTEIQSSLKEPNYENIKQYISLHEELNQCFAENADYIDMIDEVEIVSDETAETNKKSQNKAVPEYDNYIVDSNEPHTLYEDFKHKRPAKFSFNGQTFCSEKWNDMLIKTCELLADKDSKIMESFLTDKAFLGRKKHVFSNSREELRKAVRIGNLNVYVETNQSANSIKKLIRTMLNKYSTDIQSYIVYFKADYSDLHKEQCCGQAKL